MPCRDASSSAFLGLQLCDALVLALGVVCCTEAWVGCRSHPGGCLLFALQGWKIVDVMPTPTGGTPEEKVVVVVHQVGIDMSCRVHGESRGSLCFPGLWGPVVEVAGRIRSKMRNGRSRPGRLPRSQAGGLGCCPRSGKPLCHVSCLSDRVVALGCDRITFGSRVLLILASAP